MPYIEAQQVLITAPLIKRNDIDVPSQFVRQTYLAACDEAKLDPIAVSSKTSRESLHRQYQRCAAVVFTGGSDWDPSLYGQKASPETETPDKERDAFELELLIMAIEDKKPIIGICRGAQGIAIAIYLLNNVPGDSILIQHLPYITSYVHTVEGYSDLLSHLHHVDIDRETIAHTVYPEGEILIASGHHQAVSKNEAEKLPSLVISGHSRMDNVVEMIELKKSEHPFCLGIQGHPEVNPYLRKPLFRQLHIAAQRYTAQKSTHYVGNIPRK